MKKFFLLSAALMLGLMLSAQTQQGYVKTLGRPEKKGEALSGVTVRVKGEHNPVVSNNDGTFSLLLADKKNGDAYSLQQVQKNGYELNENDMIGRKFAFSDKVPLTIVMVSSEQLQADKQRIENNAYKTAEKNYKAKYNQLEKLLADNEISTAQYRKEIQDLQDKFEKYQSLIDGLAEHYAHTDYDLLDEKDREINLCIENGDLERADSLIRTLFDPIGVLERNMEALAKLDMQIGQANDIIAQANEDMAAVLKQQEKDAEYLFQLYTIAVARFDYEKALYYIETRAELDTTNAEWQFDAGCYFHQQNNFNQAEKYYLRYVEITKQEGGFALSVGLQSLADLYYDTRRFLESEKAYQEAIGILIQLNKENPQVFASYLASALNNLACLYRGTQRPTESETLHLKALELFYHLAEDNPKAHRSSLAATLNNLAVLYFDTQRYEKSEKMQVAAVEAYRQLTHDNPQIYEPDLAKGLNNLGRLYCGMKRFAESEIAILEALEIYDRLAKDNPQAYEPYLSLIQSNLAVLYSDAQRTEESEAMFLKALETTRRLARDDPQAYRPNLVAILNNLGILYSDNQRFNESEAMYLEALEIHRLLVESDQNTYEPELAMTTLNNLAILYYNTDHFSECKTIWLETMQILKRLAKDNPQAYQSVLTTNMRNLKNLAMKMIQLTQHQMNLKERENISLDALEIMKALYEENPDEFESPLAILLSIAADLHYKAHRFTESETMFLEALDHFGHLAVDNPQKYQPLLAKTLAQLAEFYESTKRPDESAAKYLGTIDIYRQLSFDDPATYEPKLAETLQSLGDLYNDNQDYEKRDAAYLEVLDIYRKLAKDNPDVKEKLSELLYRMGWYYQIEGGRDEEAEKAYKESLEYGISLAQDKPEEFESLLSHEQYLLANFYRSRERYVECVPYYVESIETKKSLYEKHPQEYEKELFLALKGLLEAYNYQKNLDGIHQVRRDLLPLIRNRYLDDPKWLGDYIFSISTLVLIEFREKNYDQAEKYLSEGLSASPEEELLLMELPIIYVFQGRDKDASEAIQQIIQKENNEEFIITLYGFIDNRKQLPVIDESQKEFFIQRFLYVLNASGYIPDADVMISVYTRGEHQSNKELEIEYLTVVDFYRGLVEYNSQAYDPELAKTLVSLADFYYDNRRYAESENTFLEAIEILRPLAKEKPEYYVPKIANALTNLANSYSKLHRYEESVLYSKEALGIFQILAQSNPRQYRNRAVIILGDLSYRTILLKQFSEAEKFAREALSIDSTKHWIYSNLAPALLFQGRCSEAEEIYQSFKSDFKKNFLQDFNEFEAAGVIPEERKADVERIRQLLAKE